MEFDKSRVYTALNADEVKPGSKVIVADELATLRQRVEENQLPDTLVCIRSDDLAYRFATDVSYMLCYLVSEPGLHWTKLKIGDVIQNVSEGKIAMVTAIDSFDMFDHIFAGRWLPDSKLTDWEKVED